MNHKPDVVLATYGSLGDLYPYLAIAIELKARGYRPLVAGNSVHRELVEEEGLPFLSVRPDLSRFDPKEWVPRATHPTRASEYIIRRLILPYLEESYADLLPAVEQAELVVTHPLLYAAKLAAEKSGVPWAAGVLQPSIFFSTYDPSVIARTPFVESLRFLGRPFYSAFFGAIKMVTRRWARPIAETRRRLGLPDIRVDPLAEGQFSDLLTLALFSPLIADRQPDWPQNTVLTGFPFLRHAGEPLPDEPELPRRPAGPPRELPPDLEDFLASGEPPIVFTLGSFAVLNPGRFFSESVEAVRRLGRRAVLTMGAAEATLLRGKDIFVCGYVPHRTLFPRAAAIVHQGGIGTTAEGLRAGKPMLIVPFANDQPDNARRAVLSGGARTVRRSRYRAERVSEELDRLLHEPRYAAAALEASRRILAESGTEAACDAIEDCLGRLRRDRPLGTASFAPEKR